MLQTALKHTQKTLELTGKYKTGWPVAGGLCKNMKPLPKQLQDFFFLPFHPELSHPNKPTLAYPKPLALVELLMGFHGLCSSKVQVTEVGWNTFGGSQALAGQHYAWSL